MEVDILNIPKLRFKEFTDEWQIKKLDKNTYIKARVGWKNLKASEYVSSGIPMIAGQHIKQGKILWDKVDFITNERYDESPEIQLKNNDIIFSKDGSLGNPAIIKNMPKKATINGTMMLIRLNYINDNVSPNYFYQICNSQYFQKMVSLIKSGGTVPHIFQRDIINFTFPIPKTLEEQEKIANFLSIVDKKVENLKNTITSLDNQKKGLLQQIFSQKLRFKDKNGNNYPIWEKKKLHELCFKIGDGLHATPKYIDSGSNYFINGNNLFNKKILVNELTKKVSNNELSKYYIPLDNNSILISLNGTIGNLAFYNNESIILGKSCGYINLKDNILKEFIYYYLLQSKIQLYFYKELTGTTIKNLSLSSLKNTPIRLPCLEEQTKIANFLSAFDRKLDNQKAQLEHWQQIKKGLLQQMFV